MYIGSLGVPQNLVFKYEHFFVSPQLKNLSHFDNLQIRKELKFPITYNFISRLISKMEKMAVFRILIILSISIASTIAKPASITGTTSEAEVVLITGGFSRLEGNYF